MTDFITTTDPITTHNPQPTHATRPAAVDEAWQQVMDAYQERDDLVENREFFDEATYWDGMRMLDARVAWAVATYDLQYRLWMIDPRHWSDNPRYWAGVA